MKRETRKHKHVKEHEKSEPQGKELPDMDAPKDPDKRQQEPFTYSTAIPDDLLIEAMQSVTEPATGEAGEPSPDETEAAINESLELERCRTEIAELKNQLMRVAAELDNYRKRVTRDKDDFQKFAAESVLKEFLPVADNMDNASQHLDKSSDFNTLKTGVEMTYKSFFDTIRKKGVAPFVSVGEPFDPTLHEAVQTMPSEEVPAGSVVSEVRRGYRLNGRLLRAALVVVSTGPQKPPPERPPERQPEEKPADGNTEEAAAPGLPVP
jgi:molecular chaperone GrpE